MSNPVKLSRERWKMLRLGKQWPAVFDPSPEPLSITVTEPLSVGTAAASITFLPAEYVPEPEPLTPMFREGARIILDHIGR